MKEILEQLGKKLGINAFGTENFRRLRMCSREGELEWSNLVLFNLQNWIFAGASTPNAPVIPAIQPSFLVLGDCTGSASLSRESLPELSVLTSKVFPGRHYLDKRLQCLSWGSQLIRPLSPARIQYAALGAYLVVALFWAGQAEERVKELVSGFESAANYSGEKEAIHRKTLCLWHTGESRSPGAMVPLFLVVPSVQNSSTAGRPCWIGFRCPRGSRVE